MVDLARAAGVSWETAAQADNTADVSPMTARKILLALEANPPSATAVALIDEPLDAFVGTRPA
ncbi:MAG: hypothetical protein DLM67_25785 [Candidatus Nephthysia bennettiae]|nr:MAG: hypothetical protein DLM67_25785 [Candidatus Dormibacteraeota bacterium]